MPVYKIHSMKWGDPNNTSVIMDCDTHEGTHMNTSTAYSAESGLWNDIKDYDQSLILPYEPPPQE